MLDLFIMMIGIRHFFILVFFIPFIFYFLWTVMKLTEQCFTSESIYNTLTFTDTHVHSVNQMVFILLGVKTKERVVNMYSFHRSFYSQGESKLNYKHIRYLIRSGTKIVTEKWCFFGWELLKII